jgi:very-short-patch-repair endonuclease
MFNCSSRNCVSRHLYVIPKSEPVPPPWVPKTKREFLGSLKGNPNEHILLAPSFVHLMDPGELSQLARRLQRTGTRTPDLKKALLERTAEIACNFSLREAVTVHRYLNMSGKDSLWLTDRINSEAVRSLSVPDLLYIISTKNEIVADELFRRSSSLSSYEMATVVNEYTKLNMETNSPSVQRLLSRISLNVSKPSVELTARDCALLANGFAKPGISTKIDARKTFNGIADSTRSQINAFTPQGAALLLHAFNKVDLATEYAELFESFSDRLVKVLGNEAEGKSIGLLMYSYGKAGISSPNLMSHISEIVKRNVQKYDFRSLATICYGFSRLKFSCDKELWRLIADEIVFRGTVKRNARVCRRISSTDIAMISKSFSRLKTGARNDEKLAFVLYQLLKRSSDSCEPSTVVEILEAYRSLPNYGGTIQSWVMRNLRDSTISNLSGIELVSVIRSVGDLGVVNRDLTLSLISNANQKISDPKLRILAAVRLCKLREYNSEFAKTSIKLISPNLPSLDMNDLIRTLFAFSEMNHRDELFVSRIIQAIRHQLKQAGPIEGKTLSTLAVSASRLRVANEEFYEDLIAKIYQSMDFFESEQSLSNTLFSMATAIGSGDWQDSAKWFAPVANGLMSKIPNDVSVEGVRQLQLVSLTIRMKKLELNDPVSRKLIERIDRVNTFASNQPSIEQSSPVHREISRILALLGLEHRNEATIGPFSLDIFVPDAKIVIEIDGPHHFFRESTLRTCSSVLKHSILDYLGFRIIHVPFHEWLQCTNEQKKLAYCSELVSRAKVKET